METIYLSEGFIITADSEPDLDGWGYDSTWWKCSDWIAWHKANKAKYGKAVANQKFSLWWNKQTMGAGPLDCRTFNSEFRQYIRANDLESAVWDGAGVFKNILDPIGAGGDIVTGVSGGVGRVGRALRWIIPGVLFAGLAYGGYRLYKYEKGRR